MLHSLAGMPLAGLLLAFLALLAAPARANQGIVAIVNDEPVTSFDVAQRQRFMALTSGMGDKMRAKLQSQDTQAKFKEFMTRHQPKSKEEAQELQKKFVDGVQQQVLSDSSAGMRKDAVEQLIEERLMIQEAKKHNVAITDDELKQALTAMAQGGQRKLSLDEFLGQFSQQGVNPKTLENKIRAQLSWRNVVRRLYGHRVQPAAASAPETTASINEAVVLDVRQVRLSVPAGADQKTIGQRLVEAEGLRTRFSSCEALPKQVKLVSGAALKTLTKAKMTDFPEETRALLAKANPGQMTTPIVAKDAVEAYAVCQKRADAAAAKKPKDEKAEKRQEDLQIYARRHLKDVKQNAHIDYR